MIRTHNYHFDRLSAVEAKNLVLSLDLLKVQHKVLLSRQISFSAGLRLFNPRWDFEANKKVFGRAIGAHGAEFCLRAAWSGPISPNDGMIVNLIEIKPLLQAAVALVEDKFLSVDVSFFRTHPPTTENIASFLWDRIPNDVGLGKLYRLQLDQSRGISVELLTDSMKVSRSYEFASAHRLFVPSLSDEENLKRFDKCSNPSGHGHNFGLRVWVEGEPDPETGFIINPRLLDSIVEREVYERFDHKHLNEDCPEFAATGLVPTTENLALTIFQRLEGRLKEEGYKLARVGLQETQKNYFEVEA